MILDRSIPLTSAQAIFLMILKRSERGMSGSEIVESLEERLGENSVPTPGAVYKILDFLSKNKYIDKIDQLRSKKDKRFKAYILSDKGSTEVRKVSEHVAKIFSFMCYCCSITVDSNLLDLTISDQV